MSAQRPGLLVSNGLVVGVVAPQRQDVRRQKAAYGPKNPRDRQILNPIEIPVGRGIVGTVAATGVAARATGTPSGAAAALPAVTPEYAERVAKLLTTHLGPIARVVVKRAGAQARDRGSFDALVAASIEDDSSRAAFMQALARLS